MFKGGWSIRRLATWFQPEEYDIQRDSRRDEPEAFMTDDAMFLLNWMFVYALGVLTGLLFAWVWPRRGR